MWSHTQENLGAFSLRSQNSRIAAVALAYLLIYFLASYMDLASTSLALQSSRVHEGNVFSTDAQVYASARAWLITVTGALIMTGCVIFAQRNASRVDPTWMQRPMRSFGLFYVNPWSRKAIGRSALHLLSFAIAFVALRLLAAGNNLMIREFGIAPIGAPIQWIGQRTSPLFGFVAVILVLFYLLAIAFSPAAAKIIASWRKA